MKFPNECCRCGACCLFETCIISRQTYNIGEKDYCPALTFDSGEATCHLTSRVPIGDGCCIKAKAYKDGMSYDFALLPKQLKIKAVQQIRRSN